MAFFVTAPNRKQTSGPSTGARIKQMLLYPHNGILFSGNQERTVGAHNNADDSMYLGCTEEARHEKLAARAEDGWGGGGGLWSPARSSSLQSGGPSPYNMPQGPETPLIAFSPSPPCTPAPLASALLPEPSGLQQADSRCRPRHGCSLCLGHRSLTCKHGSDPSSVLPYA